MTTPGHIVPESGRVEWYTPPELVERIRDFFGGRIDLDPASCAAAQRTVRAEQYFDEATDGLSKKWRGTVFCNPPYARGLMGAFADKMIAEGRGIMLTNAFTDALWWQRLAAASDAVCLISGRLAFIDGTTGKPTSGNRYGQSLFLVRMPERVQDFAEQFGAIGFVCEGSDRLRRPRDANEAGEGENVEKLSTQSEAKP